MPSGGRQPGQLNRRTIAGAEWALKIIESEEYKDSLMRRIKADNLDPRVEQTILHYAYGRPTEHITAKIENVPQGTLDKEQNAVVIAQEAAALAALLDAGRAISEQAVSETQSEYA